MKHVGILTMNSLEDFFAYDVMLDQPFLAAGWQTHLVSWRDEQTDWDKFDVVVVRSPWDYQQDPEAFLACLARIDASSAELQNPFGLMQWNLQKSYLRDLEQAGVSIVPTIWESGYQAGLLHHAARFFNCTELIVKPQVSANADDTFRIAAEAISDSELMLEEVFHQRALMIQPFLPSILSPGEYSLFYFDHQLSHAILKTPQTDDFRVQEEHGGQLTSIEASASMRAIADRTMAALPQRAFYARVDLIETDAGWAVMEVELIEPSLYFNMAEGSAQRFVDLFVNRYGKGV